MAQNSGSSRSSMVEKYERRSSMVEKYQREKSKILLVAYAIEKNYVNGDKPKYPVECPVEFHLVDLSSDQIHLRYLPSLIPYSNVVRIVCARNSVYIFGPEPPSKFDPESDESPHRPFIGSARYDLMTNNKVWSPAPIPMDNVNKPPPRFVTLVDKIYSFGRPCLEPEVVIDPVVGQTKKIHVPRQLVGCLVCYYPLPDYSDPSKPRFLLHLSDGELPSPSIYAFTPNDHDFEGNWECVATNFLKWDWDCAVAVYDNVIYFFATHYPKFVKAFDLTKGTWLNICWKSKFKKVKGIGHRYFNVVLPLGKNIFCFVLWERLPFPDPPSFKIVFFKFRVEPSNDNGVNLFGVDSYSYMLPGDTTIAVLQYLPV